MLLAIREKVTGVVALVFVGVIALFMVVPMMYQYVAGLGDNSAVRINGESISMPEFDNKLSAARQRLAQAFGGQIPEYLNQNEFLVKQTLDGVVQDELLNQITLGDGFRIPREDVVRLIMEVPEFQKDGQFDRETYKRQLNSLGYSEALFEREFTRQLAHGQFQEGIVRTAFVTQAELEAAAKLKFQERGFDYITLNAEAYRKTVEVTDEEIQSYYELNINKFQHPEKVALEYVQLSFDDYKKTVEISEDAVKNEYEIGIQAGRYSTPETRFARHILLAVPETATEDEKAAKQAEAEALVTRLKAGEDFAAIAKEVSEDPGSAAQGGDLGEISRGDMVKEFEAAVFSLEPGVVSDPVSTFYGLHIIRVDRINAAQKKPFDEVKADIKDELLTNQAREKYDADLSEVSNLAFEAPDSLQPIADLLGLTVEKTGLFTRASGEGLASESVIREAAFQPDVLIDGNNSGTLELADGRVVVVRVAEHEEARDKTLEEAKAEIEAILLNQETSAAIQTAAQELEQALLDGGDARALAKEFKSELKSAEGVTRQDAKGVAPQIQQAAFRMSRPEEGKLSVAQAQLSGGERAVVILKQVKDGSYEALAQAEKDRLREEVMGSQGNGDYAAVMNAIRAEADVVISPQLSKQK